MRLAQHRECTKCHWIVHFKITFMCVNFTAISEIHTQVHKCAKPHTHTHTHSHRDFSESQGGAAQDRNTRGINRSGPELDPHYTPPPCAARLPPHSTVLHPFLHLSPSSSGLHKAPNRALPGPGPWHRTAPPDSSLISLPSPKKSSLLPLSRQLQLSH